MKVVFPDPHSPLSATTQPVAEYTLNIESNVFAQGSRFSLSYRKGLSSGISISGNLFLNISIIVFVLYSSSNSISLSVNYEK